MLPLVGLGCIDADGSEELLPFRRRSRPRLHGFAKLSSKMLPFEIRSGRRFRQFSSKMLPFRMRSGPQFRQFSSKMLPFQIRSGPQFRHFSSKMLRFQIRSGPQFRHFSVDFTGPLEGGRVGPCRRFAFSYSFSTTRPRFARAIKFRKFGI